MVPFSGSFSGSFIKINVCLVHAQAHILVPLNLPLKLPLNGTTKNTVATDLGFHDDRFSGSDLQKWPMCMRIRQGDRHDHKVSPKSWTGV